MCVRVRESRNGPAENDINYQQSFTGDEDASLCHALQREGVCVRACVRARVQKALKTV